MEPKFIPYTKTSYSNDETVSRSEEHFNYMNERRTVREFSSEPISKEVLKNIIKVSFFKEDRIITVDKNFWRSKYHINLSDTERVTIEVTRGIDFIINQQKISIQKPYGLPKKYRRKLEFECDNSTLAQMICIVLFYEFPYRDT